MSTQRGKQHNGVRKPPTDAEGCFNCGKRGHYARDCRAPSSTARPRQGQQGQRRPPASRQQPQRPPRRSPAGLAITVGVWDTTPVTVTPDHARDNSSSRATNNNSRSNAHDRRPPHQDVRLQQIATSQQRTGKLPRGPGILVSRPHIKITVGTERVATLVDVAAFLDTVACVTLMDYGLYMDIIGNITQNSKLTPSPSLCTLTGAPIDTKGSYYCNIGGWDVTL